MIWKWCAGATRAQWLALTAALLGWLFDGFEMGIFPLVAPPALIEVVPGLAEMDRAASAASDSQQAKELKDAVERSVGLWNGRITAAFLVGAALGGWFFGWLGDRVGRVRAMVFSVMTYAIFTGLCGLAQEAWQIAGLRFLSALGMGGEWALGVALVMECWPAHSRPVLAGLIGAAANIGYLLAAFLVKGAEAVNVKMNEGGWRWVLGACAFPALLTFLLRMFVPESEKWQHAVATGPRPRLSEIFTRQLRLRTLMGTLLAGIVLIGTWGSVQWIPIWTRRLTEGNQDMASNAQICSALGAAFGAFLGAVVGQYLGRRVTYFFLCLGSLAICAYLFRWLVDPALPTKPQVNEWFFLIVFLTGALTASFYGWLPLYLPELFPTRVRATGQGFGFNFGRIIAAVGALTTGLLVNQVFHGSFAEAGATITLIYLAGMAVIWFAPETRGQPLPE